MHKSPQSAKQLRKQFYISMEFKPTLLLSPNRGKDISKIIPKAISSDKV